jgi:hypothetical protein
MAYLNITQAQRNFWKKYTEKNLRTGRSKNIIPGKIYFFNYDSKMYEEGKLAYYDAFPIILVLSVDSKYILGLAFHYLPRLTREYFIKKIILKNYKLLKKELPAHVPYYEIKNAANLWYREGMVIIRKYIRSRIKSNLVELHWREWYNAMTTEGAQWIDATAQTAYEDTKYQLQSLHRVKNRIQPPKRESNIQKSIRLEKERVRKLKNEAKKKFTRKRI